MNNLPELDYINETKVFERKKDVEHSKFELEMFNERFEKMKTLKLKQFLILQNSSIFFII